VGIEMGRNFGKYDWTPNIYLQKPSQEQEVFGMSTRWALDPVINGVITL